MNKKAVLPRWVAPVLVIALPLALYWPFVFGGKAIFWGTPLMQFWPWRQFAVEQLRGGHLPLWNPYSGNGAPLLADHQSAVLYPLNVIFMIFPTHYALGLSLALHAMLAGGTMYALARELRLTRFAALVAALAFMFSGYMVSRGSFVTEISALPWLPLIWLYTRRVIRRRQWGDAARLALAIALQFLAGHAQTWFYSLWSMSGYALWLAITCPQADRPAGHRPGIARLATRVFFRSWPIAVAVVWAVALTAAQFLPTLEQSRLAGRAARADWERYALQYSFWPWRVLTLLAPDFFGNPAKGNFWGYATYWEDAGHIGVLPFLLAVLALIAWFKGRRRGDRPAAMRETPFWAASALIALLLAMGKNTPFYMLLYRYVPGFGAFQAPARLLCIYTPAAALLAGIGADTLAPSREFGKKAMRWLVGSVGVLLASGAAFLILPGVQATFISATARLALFLTLSLLLLLWGNSMWLGHPRRRLWQLAAALFIAIDLISAGYTLNPAIDADLYRTPTEIGAFLKADGQGRTFYFAGSRQTLMFEHYLSFGDYGRAEVEHWRQMREDLLPDLGMVEHVPSANSFEPLIEARYHHLLQAIEEMPHETALRVLGMMNVAYILDPANDWDEPIIYRAPSVNVYRNPYTQPRAFIVERARVAQTAAEALALLAAPDFDPASEVILETPVNLEQVDDPTGRGSFQLDILPSRPTRVKIRAVLPRPGCLVLSDVYYPGWQATVDGERVNILRANYAFRALPLDAGEHEVLLAYKPRANWGWLGSALAAIAILAVAGRDILNHSSELESLS